MIQSRFTMFDRTLNACSIGFLLIFWISTIHAGQSPTKLGANSQRSPSEALESFYGWYLEGMKNDRDPLHDDRALMEKYVAKDLLEEIDKRTNSEDGVDADFFLQAQDYLDDWPGHIAVSDVKLNGNSATATVRLGASKQTYHQISAILTLGDGNWKIAKIGKTKAAH